MNLSQKKKLYGLVLCGGKSSRMGFEKGELIFYNNKKHKYFLYELLEEYCDEVFISCSDSQKSITDAGYKMLTDLPVYDNTGPMAALLSFREKYPDAAALAVGCDYPFIDRESIEKLIQNRNEKGVCYRNDEYNFQIYEPLLTIYEPAILKIIQHNFSIKNYSLSRLLREETVKTIDPPSDLTLRNVNSPEELTEAEILIEKFDFNSELNNTKSL